MPQFVDCLNKSLPRFILRMRFPGKDELNRSFLVVAHRGQPLKIAHDHRGPLIRRKTAPEANRQYIRIQDIACRLHGVIAFASPTALSTDSSSHEREQEILQR